MKNKGCKWTRFCSCAIGEDCSEQVKLDKRLKDGEIDEKQHDFLIACCQSNKKDSKELVIMPEVGMGVTISSGSDSRAYTVISVSASGKTATIQRDKATRIDKNGMSEDQEYKYERDPEGNTAQIRLCKRGFSRIGNVHCKAYLGHRREYFDPHF